MSISTTLTSSDADLLLQMLCCVIAADKKVSGKEVQVVTDVLSTHSNTMLTESVKDVVIKYCKEIHAKGVDSYVAQLVPRLAARKDTAIADVFDKVKQALIAADGESSPAEERIAASLLAALRNPISQNNSVHLATEVASGGTPSAVTVDSVAVTTADSKGLEPWKVALAIGLIYPYGLYLLWTHPNLSSNKWWWRFAIAWPVVFGLMSASVSPPSGSNAPKLSKVATLQSKITRGMTQKQVLAAIGKPKKKNKVKNPIAGMPNEDWSYENDKFAVFFEDGVVVWTIPE